MTRVVPMSWSKVQSSACEEFSSATWDNQKRYFFFVFSPGMSCSCTCILFPYSLHNSLILQICHTQYLILYLSGWAFQVASVVGGCSSCSLWLFHRRSCHNWWWVGALAGNTHVYTTTYYHKCVHCTCTCTLYVTNPRAFTDWWNSSVSADTGSDDCIRCASHLHNGWGGLYPEPCILCWEGLPYSWLWYVGARFQGQRWKERAPC